MEDTPKLPSSTCNKMAPRVGTAIHTRIKLAVTLNLKITTVASFYFFLYKDGAKCLYDPNQVVAKVSNLGVIKGDENQMMQETGNNGPIAVLLHADLLMHYK